MDSVQTGNGKSAQPWRTSVRLPGRATAAKHASMAPVRAPAGAGNSGKSRSHGARPCQATAAKRAAMARRRAPAGAGNSGHSPGWCGGSCAPSITAGAENSPVRFCRSAPAAFPQCLRLAAGVPVRHGLGHGCISAAPAPCLRVYPLRCFFSPSPAATPPPKRPRSRAHGGFAPRPARDPPRSAADRK